MPREIQQLSSRASQTFYANQIVLLPEFPLFRSIPEGDFHGLQPRHRYRCTLHRPGTDEYDTVP